MIVCTLKGCEFRHTDIYNSKRYKKELIFFLDYDTVVIVFKTAHNKFCSDCTGEAKVLLTLSVHDHAWDGLPDSVFH